MQLLEILQRKSLPENLIQYLENGGIYSIFRVNYAMDEAQAETVNIRDEAASVAAFQKLNHESQIQKKTTDVLDVEKKSLYI